MISNGAHPIGRCTANLAAAPRCIPAARSALPAPSGRRLEESALSNDAPAAVQQEQRPTDRADDRHRAGSAGSKAGYAAVLRNRSFVLLWLGQAVSQAGDAIYFVGLFWLMRQISDSPSMLGLLGMAETLPLIAFGLPMGALVDRYERRRLMIACDVCRAGILALVAVLYSAGALTPWFLLASAFCLAIFTRAFNPAKQALICGLVDEKDLPPANALSSVTQQTMQIIGPPVAGLLIAALSARAVFIFDAVSFGVSAAFIALLLGSRLRYSQPRPTGSLWSSVADGLRFVARQRWLAVYTPLETFFMFLWMGPWIAGLVLYVGDLLHAGPEMYGVILGVNSAGFMLGSAAYGQFGARLPRSLVVIWSGLTSGLFLIVFVAAHAVPTPLLVALFFVQGLLAGPGPIAYTSMIQAMVPPDRQGRVFSTVAVLNGLANPASFGLTGMLVGALSIGHVWVGAGALILLAYGPMTLLNKRIVSEEYGGPGEDPSGT